MLTQEEAFARIRLLRSPNIGPVSYAMLLARFGTATEAPTALPDLGGRGGRQYRAAPADRIEREVEAVRRAGAKHLFHDQPEYPRLFGEMDGAPPILTWRGTCRLRRSPAWPWSVRATPALPLSNWRAISRKGFRNRASS